MFARTAGDSSRRSTKTAFALAGVFSAILIATGIGNDVRAQVKVVSTRPHAALTAADALGPSFTLPIADESPPKIVIDSPLPELLGNGIAVIQFRTENMRVMPVFGPAALGISPRVGHLHIRLDDAPFGWAHTSSQELIIADLAPGPHKVRIELADANHRVLSQDYIEFEVPRPSPIPTSQGAGASRVGTDPRNDDAGKAHSGAALAAPADEQPPAKLIVDPPLPALLAKGLALVQYRTENVRILPLFGAAGVAVSPRVGHLHVTVDDAPWHWADASGGPVIVAGLRAGRHKIRIELANAEHKVLDQNVVEIQVP